MKPHWGNEGRPPRRLPEWAWLLLYACVLVLVIGGAGALVVALFFGG